MSFLLKPKVYRLKSNRYQVSYINPASKKRVRRKFEFLRDAEGFEQSLYERFLSSNHSSADSVKVWMSRYLELSPTARITKQGKPLMKSFMENFGYRSVLSVNHDELSNWLDEIKQSRNYSSKSMLNNKSSINQFFQFIVDTQALKLNPVVNIKIAIEPPVRQRTTLADDEIKELLERLKVLSPALIYPVVFILAHTGMRLGEALKLKWNDVHFGLNAVQLIKTKNGEDRLIQVSDEVLVLLQNQPKICESVFIGIYGREWTVAQYRKQFNKIRANLGFGKYWCNHVLRHSFATNYLKQGGDMLQLQKILGHKDLKMTVDLYGQIESQDVKDISPYDF